MRKNMRKGTGEEKAGELGRGRGGKLRSEEDGEEENEQSEEE